MLKEANLSKGFDPDSSDIKYLQTKLMLQKLSVQLGSFSLFDNYILIGFLNNLKP